MGPYLQISLTPADADRLGPLEQGLESPPGTVPGIEEDGARRSLEFALVSGLVSMGFGRPANRGAAAGGRYCLLVTNAPRRGYLLTFASGDPRLLVSLRDFVLSLLRRRDATPEEGDVDARIAAIAREMDEPVERMRRSVRRALEAGRSLGGIEVDVGIRAAGTSFEEAAAARVLDLDAAAEAVGDLLTGGADRDRHASLRRYPGRTFVTETELERVERGIDRETGRPVEVLILDRASARRRDVLSAFLAPALASWRFDHPNIVSTIALGRDDEFDRLFAVREAPGGTPLGGAGAPEGSPVEAAAVLRAGAEALAALHDRQIVHGGIRPGTLIRDRSGGIRLTGFGRARAAGARSVPLAEDDPGLVPPECGRRRRANPREDVFALGATVRRLSAGRPLPAALRLVVARMTAGDPRDRHRSGRELVRDLNAVRAGLD